MRKLLVPAILLVAVAILIWAFLFHQPEISAKVVGLRPSAWSEDSALTNTVGTAYTYVLLEVVYHGPERADARLRATTDSEELAGTCRLKKQSEKQSEWEEATIGAYFRVAVPLSIEVGVPQGKAWKLVIDYTVGDPWWPVKRRLPTSFQIRFWPWKERWKTFVIADVPAKVAPPP